MSKENHVFTFTIISGEHNYPHDVVATKDGIEVEDTGDGTDWDTVLAALNKVRGNADCDHVIGQCSDESDYQYTLEDVKVSDAEALKKDTLCTDFFDHNFCHVCGADVSAISTQTKKSFYG